MNRQLVLLVCVLGLLGSCYALFCQGECQGIGIRCVDPFTYQYCTNFSEYAIPSSPTKKCPDGTICDNKGMFPCKVGEYIPPVPTTPAPNASCVEGEKRPAPDPTQYYECGYNWFEWKFFLMTCPAGTAYKDAVKDCVQV